MRLILISALLMIPTLAMASPQSDLLKSLVGSWHSVSGSVEGSPGSTCTTTQSLAVTQAQAASVSFSIQCSTQFQLQQQGLVLSEWVTDSSGNPKGARHVEDTTWGFGTAQTHQIQTVTLTGGGSKIDFTYSNQQAGWSNTVIHLSLVRD